MKFMQLPDSTLFSVQINYKTNTIASYKKKEFKKYKITPSPLKYLPKESTIIEEYEIENSKIWDNQTKELLVRKGSNSNSRRNTYKGYNK